MKLRILTKILICIFLFSNFAFAGARKVSKFKSATDANKFFYVKAGAAKGHYSHLKTKGFFYARKKPANKIIMNAALGIKTSMDTRLELEFLKTKTRFEFSKRGRRAHENQKTSVNVLFLNGYSFLGNFNNFCPFIKAGLGISMNRSGKYYFYPRGLNNTAVQPIKYGGKKSKSVAFNLGFGAEYKFKQKFFAGAEYTFGYYGYMKVKGVKDATLINDSKSPLKAHMIKGFIGYGF